MPSLSSTIGLRLTQALLHEGNYGLLVSNLAINIRQGSDGNSFEVGSYFDALIFNSGFLELPVTLSGVSPIVFGSSLFGALNKHLVNRKSIESYFAHFEF